ncbi:DUF2975 domain-containing protein [Rufibacter sp. XAAS-G3-1]|uniref:DUF2975 domain-containing protein n=1 Tax=Rufibacter sp. XAAS-G3-1 TaxID=2729134 RepID=UPI0015E6F8E5|nr:DUF2975 domain-containing protein [Rufibacter sp. XAAS-G3-1]
METKTKLILTVLNIISWVVFIGLCMKTGAIVISFFVSLFVNPEGARDLYLGLDLHDLYSFSLRHYVGVVSLVVFLSGLKAYLAYLVVKIFSKFDYANPFNSTNAALISQISHIALGTGVLAVIASSYSKVLLKSGIALPLHWESSEFLFLAGIIFIIAQVFKRGIELQTENELTV